MVWSWTMANTFINVTEYVSIEIRYVLTDGNIKNSSTILRSGGVKCFVRIMPDICSRNTTIYEIFLTSANVESVDILLFERFDELSAL